MLIAKIINVMAEASYTFLIKDNVKKTLFHMFFLIIIDAYLLLPTGTVLISVYHFYSFKKGFPTTPIL